MCFYPEKRHTEGKSHGSGNIRKYGAPPGHGIGNGLQMAGKDFIAGESGNESNRAFVKDKKLTGEGNASV